MTTTKYTIYQIKHKQLPHCYIGSTKNFYGRVAVHKTYYKQGIERQLYNTMQQNGGWDSYDIIPLEEFECSNRTEAESRENHWIKRFEGEMELLNTYKRSMGSIPEGTTRKWYYKSREHHMQLSREYYYKNRESILERLKGIRNQTDIN